MQEQHKRFGFVSSSNIVELNAISSHVFVSAIRLVLEDLWRNYRSERSEM